MMRCVSCYYLVILFIFEFIGNSTAATEPNHKSKICKSVEINKMQDFTLLENCQIVVGHVQIVHLYIDETSVIPDIKVEEITDYLVVYRFHGVRSLKRIFPRLKLIRGQELIFNRYSLIVFENRDLENLGLISLLRIQNGAIRIEKNPVLCFVDTINWVYLLGNKTRQHFSFNNKPSHQCPLCLETLEDIDEDKSLKKHCWNLTEYQSNTVFGNLKDCSPECGIRGCDKNGVCCSRRCLTGCSDSNCELCGTLKQNGRCVDICSFTLFQLNKRDCVPEADCIKNGLIPHAAVCIEKCPKHYEKKIVNGKSRCILSCVGNYKINNADDLSGLEDCTVIQGSLIIELTDIKAKIVEELERALANIKEITGYLKIKNSPQLVSLQFLRNLHTIRGNELMDGKYALYVVNNHHLEHIWRKGQNVAILNGRIYFHLNPRLCREKIMALLPSLKAVQRITPVDASPNSNGERVICGEFVRILNATVEDFNATAVRIKVDPMSADDKEVLVGYAHYYKEAPLRNVTRYDGRHGCGHDNWLMDISANLNVRHIIGNLKPFTQYAYFVKTLTMTDYHTQLDAYSNIQYFRTLPSKPGPPAKVYYHTLSTSEIMIHWWPPLSPNGIITNYLILYDKIKDNSSTDATTNYLIEATKRPAKSICKCNIKDPFYSGPPPEDENFYNKEQLIYDEALSNFIYVAKPTTSKRDDNNTPQNSNSNKTTDSKSNAMDDNSESIESNTIEDSSMENNTESVSEDQRWYEYQKYREELERKSLALQDTGILDFQIIKYPICKQDNASVQYQIENDCRTIEHFEGIRIPGHIHQHILNGLDPESSYRISVRACQETGECGGEIVVTAKTISKTLEDFFKGAQKLANDVEN